MATQEGAGVTATPATAGRRGTRARRPLDCRVLRDLRHAHARAAREVTVWLSELANARRSPRTIREYGRIADGLMGHHPGKRLEDFTVDDLSVYLASFREPSRPVVKSALQGLFRWAYRRGYVPSNPVELLMEIKQPEQKLVTVFTDVEAETLCGLPSPDGALMRTLLSTGVRRAEAMALQVRHVNFDQRHIEVLKGKGGHDRLVPLTPTLAGKLDHWFTVDAMERDDFLWYSRPGGHWRDHSRRIASSTFHRWWDSCISEAGVEYRNPHATRHTFATRSIRAGVPPDKVRRALGHRKLATTMEMYVHMSVDDLHDDFALVELA